MKRAGLDQILGITTESVEREREPLINPCQLTSPPRDWTPRLTVATPISEMNVRNRIALAVTGLLGLLCPALAVEPGGPGGPSNDPDPTDAFVDSICLPHANCNNLLEAGGSNGTCVILDCSSGSLDFRACVPVDFSDRPCFRTQAPVDAPGNGVVATCNDCDFFNCRKLMFACDCDDAVDRRDSGWPRDGHKETVALKHSC